MSRNYIALREELKFGKHKGTLVSDLLDFPEGIGYLVWCYNNTDIQIEDCIKSELYKLGLINPRLERKNSREWGGAIRDAYAHEKRNQVAIEPGGNLTMHMPIGRGKSVGAQLAVLSDVAKGGPIPPGVYRGTIVGIQDNPALGAKWREAFNNAAKRVMRLSGGIDEEHERDRDEVLFAGDRW
ncbi:MAG: hypothetical protein ACN2B6_12580 [Rickettsiales bacterium]